MLIDTHLGGLESASAAAAAAEAAGYDGVFTGELNNDPFLPLALAAAATERVDIGTSIAVAFSRSPMSVAYTAYDLQRFSGGRLVLGLGSQVRAHITRRFSMPWGRPAAQMREFVLAMRAAWDCWAEGGSIDFDGEFYRQNLMPPTFMPARHEYGQPLVYLAGVGDGMTRVAGEVADGFLCHAFTTERWIRERTVPALTEGRRRAGMPVEDFTVKAAVFLATGSDADIDAEVATIRSHLAFYASTPAYRSVLDLHGWGDLGQDLTSLSKEGRWSEMGRLIDDEVLNAFAIVAPLQEVPERLVKRCAGVVDRVSFISKVEHPSLLDSLRSHSPDARHDHDEEVGHELGL
jgi:probable F420-dependent oxidoreductase